ncbi:hypothetical protein C8Q70DRAFT_991416 [Cubamyces menziesii]|nr:hypothetical protein C8Q70DRAFT_991416 [Cubamyces menziesii]
MSLLERSMCTRCFCLSAIAATFMTARDCFACATVRPVGFVGLCGSSASLGFFRKVFVATEERAERRGGGSAIEVFVMLVSRTGYGAQTVGLKLDPR